MGSIRQRSLTDGTIRYRAEIRINRTGYPEYKESKTFSSRRIAENWVHKREKELNANPELLSGKKALSGLTIGQAIEKYLLEVEGVYSKTKVNTLKLMQKLPIAKRQLKYLKSGDIADHVSLRKEGYAKLHLSSVLPSTIQNELLQIRSVLVHASIMWDMDVDLNGFDKTTAQLRKTRQIAPSTKRDRLPKRNELKRLLEFFARKWNEQEYSCYPMHYIILFAIFSCRREAEITRLHLDDYDQHHQYWLVKSLKSPKGSAGNHKEFKVLEPCQQVIELFMQPVVRKRMLIDDYDLVAQWHEAEKLKAYFERMHREIRNPAGMPNDLFKKLIKDLKEYEHNLKELRNFCVRGNCLLTQENLMKLALLFKKPDELRKVKTFAGKY